MKDLISIREIGLYDNSKIVFENYDTLHLKRNEIPDNLNDLKINETCLERLNENEEIVTRCLIRKFRKNFQSLNEKRECENNYAKMKSTEKRFIKRPNECLRFFKNDKKN